MGCNHQLVLDLFLEIDVLMSTDLNGSSFESLCSGIQGLPVSTTFAIDHCIESTHTPSISYVVEMIITKQVTIHSRRGTLLR